MKDVCWSCTEKLCQPDEAKREIQSLFGNGAWFLLEQSSGFLAGKLGSLPDNWADGLLACTVFDASSELRAEPDQNGLALRIVCEGKGENRGLARHTSYLLARHEAARPLGPSGPLAQGATASLDYVEYFSCNAESGMPEFSLGRLCGVGGTERG